MVLRRAKTWSPAGFVVSKQGHTTWINLRQSRLPPPRQIASPEFSLPWDLIYSSLSDWMAGPPASERSFAKPSVCCKFSLELFTIASTCSFMILPLTISNFTHWGEWLGCIIIGFITTLLCFLYPRVQVTYSSSCSASQNLTNSLLSTMES